MILDGFDVAAVSLDTGGAWNTEITPNVMIVGWYGDEFAHYSPDGHPDGRVGVWTVPANVHAITFQMFGSLGGVYGGFGLLDPVDYQTPVVHTRRLPVTPGDEVVVAAGGPQSYYGIGIPTHGNGPIRGGWGGQDSERVGGAGGGASALWLNGDLIALGPGGGGWVWHYIAPPYESIPASSAYPIGTAGAVSVGTPTFGVAAQGGGGGGAPGGAGGAGYFTPGDNGAAVLVPADSGGPPSPMWGAETTIAADYHGGAPSGVRIFHYIQPPGGWSVGRIAW